MVQILLYYHVSDITIGEPLIFNVNELQKNIHSQGVTIRIRPDKARTGIETTLVEESGINHFWLLPQHISLYENYVDVIDLIDNSVTRESELVNIYTRNQPYSAMIDTLILGLNCPIGADFFDDKFEVRRLTCGQTCIKNKNNCHFCDQYAKMYDVIAAQRKSSN